MIAGDVVCNQCRQAAAPIGMHGGSVHTGDRRGAERKPRVLDCRGGSHLWLIYQEVK